MIRTAVTLLSLLAAGPALAAAAPQAAGTHPPEPLSLALQERHVAAADLGGREVFDDEETRIGVMHVLPVPAPGSGSARFLIELSPALGIGEGCITAPLGGCARRRSGASSSTSRPAPSWPRRGSPAARIPDLRRPSSVVAAQEARLDQEPHGRLEDGTPVHRHLLEASRLRVAVLTLGGIIERLETPDARGEWANVVLGLRSPGEYRTRSPYFGALVGRYANRIARGRFTLDGRDYQLATTDGPNALHGGRTGFDKRIWTVEAATPRRLDLSLVSGDGDEGYPGTLRVHVTYALDGEESLRVAYAAKTDAPTVLNLTNHTYWNLGGEGSGSVLGHEITIEADAYLPTDPTMIPTGEIAPVAGTPFDFRAAAQIGARIRDDQPQLLAGLGYDHCWALRGGVAPEPRPAARLRDPGTGRVMTVLTDQPGLQFYSGNRLDGSLVGPSGRAYRQGDGLALETQHFPDSPNQPAFPNTVLRPGETFRSTTILRFSTDPA
ncbi:aldose epimerase family protein [Roseomonas sp. CCTCC AB2023176]|uniref:aldose epimerase family protein n=1 Tax=Roseomonas sp. CCTCC AB2023176 TaxID=3342640 RepID=UPI0035D57BDD